MHDFGLGMLHDVRRKLSELRNFILNVTQIICVERRGSYCPTITPASNCGIKGSRWSFVGRSNQEGYDKSVNIK